MVAQVYALANQKGGVGKTTTAVNLATSLAACGKRILLIDSDPQGNASTGLGIRTEQRTKGLYDLLVGRINSKQAVIETDIPNISLISATVELAAAEVELMNFNQPQYRLKSSLEAIVQDYDMIIVDCPPALGLLTINALVASSRVLVPLQTEFYALEGLAHLLKTIETVRRNFNSGLELKGVVLTMYDKRNRLSEVVEKDVRQYLGGKVFDTIIPRNIKVSEAPSHGLPVILYDMKSAGSRAYIALAAELLRREGVSLQGEASAVYAK